MRDVKLTTIRPDQTAPILTGQAMVVDYVSCFPRFEPTRPRRFTPECDAHVYREDNRARMLKEITEEFSRSMIVPKHLLMTQQLRR